MRHVLTDEEAAPARWLLARSAPHRLADVAGAEHGGAAAVIQGFVDGLRAHHLARLRELTDRGVGYGSDLGFSMFDDDLEPDDEVFEGVLVGSSRLPDQVVMSRTAYRRLVDALLALPPPR